MHNEVDQAKTRPVRLLKKQEGWREREESRNARATLDAKRDDHTARA